MPSSTPLASRKKNLLLCLDAFGTLFTPSIPIPIAYARAAARHGLRVGDTENPHDVRTRFGAQFQQEARRHPNYGKATGLRGGAEQWWYNVIRGTFTPFLQAGQSFPDALARDLLHRYSSRQGYTLFDDVEPLFDVLRHVKLHHDHHDHHHRANRIWPWDKTVVGIVTNSDDRVPGILESFRLSVGPSRVGTTDTKFISDQDRLSNDVNFVVLSYDVGFEKPHANMFRAAETLGETVSGIKGGTLDHDFDKLFVGDDVDKDYFAAKDAGWGSVLLQRLSSTRMQADMTKGVRTVEVKAKDGRTSLVDAVSSLSDLAAWQPKKS